MIIIGEKINGTRQKVAEAILNRNVEFIQDLASRQVEAGAGILDVNAGTQMDRESDDLVWLIQTIEAVTDVPLALDSANPRALSAACQVVKRTPILNSLSGEKKRVEGVLPLACERQTGLIILALDDIGIPTSVEKRLEIVLRLVEMTRRGGLPDNQLYIDPLVTTLATDTASGQRAFEAMRQIKNAVPDAHLTVGLSNISFGLPARSVVNQAFAVLAMAAGLDSAIIDPEDPYLRSILYAGEMVLGQDRLCINYLRAYRGGLISTPPKK